MVKPLLIGVDVLRERDSFLDDAVKGKSLFDVCRDDFVVFCDRMLGLRLYGWQYLVALRINAGDRRFVLNTSRQVGKSKLASALSLWYAVFNKAGTGDGGNTKVGVISGTDDQAKKLMLEIKNLIWLGDEHCRKYSKLKDDVFSFGVFSYLVDNGQGAENNRSAITFKRYEEVLKVAPWLLQGAKIGCFIKSLPPTDIVRGNTFDLLIVDEAALIDDDIYTMAISKTGDKYNAVRIISSTPRGHVGFFYDLFDPENKYGDESWTRFWFTIDAIRHDCPDEYVLRMKDVEKELTRGKYLTVRQEYYGEFVQSETAFFKPEKVDGMIDVDAVMLEGFNGSCDLGVDFGGLRVSRTVLTVCAFDEETGEVRRIHRKVYGVREDGNIMDDIIDLKKRFNVERVVVDDCPEGDYKIREMEQKGWSVTRMSFAKEKIKKYGEFRAKLNKGLIKSFVDAELVAEMKALQQLEGTQRTMIKHAPGMTDDLIDSFLMGAYHMVTDDDGFKFYDVGDA